MQQAIQQLIIVCMVHKTKADVFVVEKRKGGAVTNHHALPDCRIKYILGGKVLPQKAYQHKIAGRPVYLKIRMGRQDFVNAVSLRSNQLFRLCNIILVPEHDFSGDDCKRVDGPGILTGVDGFDQIPVAGDGIAKPQARCGKEFGGTPQDDDVIVVICERNRGDLFHIVSKFHIGLIHHHKDIMLLAGIQDMAHFLCRDTGGGWIVWIADYD